MTWSTAEVSELAELAATLVDIPSVSHNEREIADFVEARLADTGAGVLEVSRFGDNVCARTRFGLPQRLVLAGHLDTVPPNGNERSSLESGSLYGLGSADMKGGDAVFLELARSVCEASRDGATPAGMVADLTWLFYVCEEVDRRYSGLLALGEADPSWLEADAAVLGEPTGAAVEAGCQGVLRVVVEARGERAHSARPWMGRNAIHRLGPAIEAVASYEGRRPVIDGCEYREALQAVGVEGGVANNVVPDHARLVVNHRFAPDRSVDQAFDAVRNLLESALAEPKGSSGAPAEWRIVLEDSSPAAPPGLGHPVLAALSEVSGQPARAKLGWTDVSLFAERGVPAVNYGPGDPEVAHSAREHVPIDQLERVYVALASVLLGTDG
jgi:succinyl-diaminopimelate desuccinylase